MEMVKKEHKKKYNIKGLFPTFKVKKKDLWALLGAVCIIIGVYRYTLLMGIVVGGVNL